MLRMKVGLLFANSMAMVQPAAAIEVAEYAEANGVESVWTVEHVVVPGGYKSAYPYSRSGRMPGGEDSPIPDPLIWLAFVAARTTSIRLATGMMILPQRNPVITAKALATLDVLSGGRVVLGAGIGWLKEEFDIIGVPFKERGTRTDEAIEAMRVLWRDDQPTYHGRHFNFDDARLWPKPVEGVIPIVIGGHSEPAARRAGRLGDGFFPAARDVDENARVISVMRQAAEDAGRDPAAIEITLGGWPDAETVGRYREIGVSRIGVPLLAPDVGAAKGMIDSAMQALRESGEEG
jgi:probable F420-dependent oxidoreductase